MGLPHGRLLVRAEHWFGQYGNVGLRVGSFAPAFLLGLPYCSITFAAFAPQDWGHVTAFVYAARDHTAEAFDWVSAFSTGVIAGSEVKVDTHFFGLPGQQHVGVLWKHVPLTDLRFGEPPPGEYPEPTVPGLPTIPDSYTLFHGFDQ